MAKNLDPRGRWVPSPVKKPMRGNAVQQVLNEMDENVTDLTWPFVDGEPSHKGKRLGMKKKAAEQSSNQQEIVIEIGSLVPTTPTVVSAEKKRVGRATDAAGALQGTHVTPFSPPPSKKRANASIVAESEKGADETFGSPFITWI